MDANPLIGSVGIFAGNFAPRMWSFCHGQLLAISSNTALFSILGTTYGGDGRTTFALPDLRGRSPLGAGRGPGLTDRRIGQRIGREQEVLSAIQMPAHTHQASGTPMSVNTTGLSVSISGAATASMPVNSSGDTDNPQDAVFASNPNGDTTYASSPDGNSMIPMTVDTSGLGGSINGTATVNSSGIQIANTGNSLPFSCQQPDLAINYCIAIYGIYPSRS